ncbi:hypothetical protein MHU86_4492 [Fragilaria crotonensis]|nr:hypothetical protein MHU86_4492 [Fragilaria crotonensis]
MSYLKTYDKLIKNPEDMLLPCTLAIDKTTCDIGGGGRLSLEPIVLSYGLMKHDIRKTPAAMRVLGFINTTPVKERDSSPGVPKANTPLPIVSSSLVSDACYRVNEYHLQIDFILRVAQLCRACECPTGKSGYSKARAYPKRTPKSVNEMVTKRQFDLLKSNSQQFLINAFDSVRFGAHNDRGIFGACPGEILHLVLLGWFKNVLDSFFKQIERHPNLQGGIIICYWTSTSKYAGKVIVRFPRQMSQRVFLHR